MGGREGAREVGGKERVEAEGGDHVTPAVAAREDG